MGGLEEDEIHKLDTTGLIKKEEFQEEDDIFDYGYQTIYCNPKSVYIDNDDFFPGVDFNENYVWEAMADSNHPKRLLKIEDMLRKLKQA